MPDPNDRFGRFVRSVPGPDEEYECHGGRLRVVAVDINEASVIVRWRLTGELDLAAAFPEETQQLEREISGLDVWAAERVTSKALRDLRARYLFGFGLEDDLGTPYARRNLTAGGVGEKTGDARYCPAPPPNATTLNFKWLDVRIDIPLKDHT